MRSIEEYDSLYETPEHIKDYIWGTRLGWEKYSGNPIIGGEYGTCFDLTLMKEAGKYRAWFSWRPKKCIAYCESDDGLHFSPPQIVLEPVYGSCWEGDELNRSSIIKVNGKYIMLYSGQMMPYKEEGRSVLGYAESADGINWTRPYSEPVLVPDQPWEKNAIMCPELHYDEETAEYQLWYSGGGNHEPDAIGYAVSKDCVHWVKHAGNPILSADKNLIWERHKVSACQIIHDNDWYYMLYIGFTHEERASIGMARSRNGIDGWERHPMNPIIAPSKDGFDSKAVYKPYAMWDEDHWTLWYNGAKYDFTYFDFVLEQIGAAFLYRRELWI